MLTFAILFLTVACLAYANGANDNFKGVATLFGSFDLLKLFLPEPAKPAPMSLDKNAPKMRTEKQAGAGGSTVIVTTLDWQPKFLEPDGKLDLTIAAITKNHGGTSVLDISGTITKPINPGALGAPPLGDVTSDFSGSLNFFQVSVLASVFINFSKFSFRKRTNEKADVKVRIQKLSDDAFTEIWEGLHRIKRVMEEKRFEKYTKHKLTVT